MGSRAGSTTVVDRSEPGVAVLALHGEHDLATVPELQDELGRLLEEGVPIVADLSETTFMDCATLTVLEEGQRRARAGGLGFVVVLGTGLVVRRLFELTGYEGRFSIVGTRAEAVNHVRSREGDE